MADTVRLSLNYSPDVADEIKSYARRKGVTVTEAVRRAIAVLEYIDAAQQRGAAIHVNEGGQLKEVVFLG